MTVTFCGHGREIYDAETEQILTNVLEELIKFGADEFLMGGYGAFDALSARVVKKLKEKYDYIKSVLVIPYINRKYKMESYDESVYPPLENVPYRLAVIKRNEWMILNSQIVVAYVKYPYSGAYKMLSFAKRQQKQIINIYNTN